jgi:hypothetical protein
MEPAAAFSEMQFNDRKHRTRIFYTALLLFIGVLFVVSTQFGQRQILPFEGEDHETSVLQASSSAKSTTLKIDSSKVCPTIWPIMIFLNSQPFFHTIF